VEWREVRRSLHGQLTAADATTARTIASLADRSAETRGARHSLLSDLLASYHRGRDRRWSMALTLAYWPMLSALRRRIPDVVDGDQLVLTAFLEALAGSVGDRDSRALAWRTRRQLFRAIRNETTPRFESLVDVAADARCAERPLMHRALLRAIEKKHGLVVLAALGGEPLEHLIACAHPDAATPERRSLRMALKQRRARARARLQHDFDLCA